jgi:hypothetical protein
VEEFKPNAERNSVVHRNFKRDHFSIDFFMMKRISCGLNFHLETLSRKLMRQ